MTEDVNRLLTRIQHMERARDTYAFENRRLLNLLGLADQLVAASITGNGLDFAHYRDLYRQARQEPA